MTDRLALPRRYRDQLEALLREHVPGVEVWAYGSRVNGESHEGSDLDLVLRGPALEPVGDGYFDLLEAIEKSNIPILVQAHDWARLPESFHKEMERGYVVVQRGAGQAAEGEWRRVPFQEVVYFQEGPGIRHWQYRDKGVPFVNIRCLVDGRLDVSSMNRLEPIEVNEKYQHFLLDAGDYVVSSSGTIGRIAEVSEDDLPCMLNTSVIRMRSKDESLLNRRYLRYFLTSSLFQEQIYAFAAGSVQVNYGPTHLNQMWMALPPLSEQRAIAHILGTLDDKIELNRRMNETLDAMARAIFQDWFVDFGPVRAKLKGREPYLPPELLDLFPDRLVDSELGEIPEGWEVGVLDDAIEILSGGTPRTSISEYWDGDIPWYTAKDAPSLSDIFVLDTERSITQAGVDRSSTKVLPAGTTVITARGTVGRLACLGIPMAMNQTCYGIRGAKGYPDFCTYWNIRNTVSDLQARTHGTIFDTITRETFKIAETVLPPIDVARAFETIVNPPMKRILRNLNESRALAAQRDALLPKLVSGELRVGDRLGTI